MNGFHLAFVVGSLLYLIASCFFPEAAGDDIRLVNGDHSCSGRVEIYHDGQWGTVCDDAWDILDAIVVCRQLGCGAAISAQLGAFYGQGSEPTWMDNVHCNGLESNLSDCVHNGFGVENCGHSEDASVDCPDECAGVNCGPNANCTSTPGNHNCICYQGYLAMNPGSMPNTSNPCEDVDECVSNPCGSNAECYNTLGSFNCACDDGYITSSGLTWESGVTVCENVDKCFSNPCGSNTECYNTPGSFYCTCQDGYISSSGLTWESVVTVCKSQQEFLDSLNPPEGQSYEMFFLKKIAKNLEDNPDIILPEKVMFHLDCSKCVRAGIITGIKSLTIDGDSKRTVTSILRTVLSVADASGVEGPGGRAELANIVLKNAEGLVSALVEPTLTQTEKSVKAPTMEISTVAIGPESNMTETQALVAKGNMMAINLTAVAKNNNGSAAVALMTVSGMEKFLSLNSSKDESVTEIYSDIIIATLPKTKHRELPEPVIFTMSHKKRSQTGLVTCVYWKDRGEEAYWSVEGCTASFSNETHTVCICTHLSSFAILLQTEQAEDEDDHLLEMVNLVCMCIGLTFLALTILTFLLCTWNPKVNNTARLHLCICLFLGHLLFLVGVSRTEDSVMCAVIAGMLHFLFLSSFVWMLLETLQLFLLIRSLTKVQIIQKEGLRALYLLLIGYGAPLVVVGVSAAVFSDGYGSKDQCWLSNDQNFHWSFIGPVCAILALNLVSFCVILWSLRPTLANMTSDISQSKDTRLIIFKIVAQFFVLGCAWILGFFQTSIILKYLFIILNSQQGTFIFIVHCLLNKAVQEEYRTWLKCFCRTEGPSGSRST